MRTGPNTVNSFSVQRRITDRSSAPREPDHPRSRRSAVLVDSPPRTSWRSIRPTESSEDRSIDGPVPTCPWTCRSRMRTWWRRHHDLELLVRLGPPPGDDEPKKPAEAEVEQGEGHGRCCPRSPGKCQFREPIYFWRPSARGAGHVKASNADDQVARSTSVASRLWFRQAVRSPGREVRAVLTGVQDLRLANCHIQGGAGGWLPSFALDPVGVLGLGPRGDGPLGHGFLFCRSQDQQRRSTRGSSSLPA